MLCWACATKISRLTGFEREACFVGHVSFRARHAAAIRAVGASVVGMKLDAQAALEKGARHAATLDWVLLLMVLSWVTVFMRQGL